MLKSITVFLFLFAMLYAPLTNAKNYRYIVRYSDGEMFKTRQLREKNKIIDCTGPEYYTLKDWVLIASNNKVKFLPIPKSIIDLPFRLIISIFPSIMNKDQYLLLGSDNIADRKEFETFLGRETKSTAAYWKHELTA